MIDGNGKLVSVIFIHDTPYELPSVLTPESLLVDRFHTCTASVMLMVN